MMRTIVAIVVAGAALGAISLVGCGGSSDPGQAPTAVVQEASWTTLGTRETASEPSAPVTSNAGATWVDYDPPALFPNASTTKNEFITMKDGTLLAANVTVPADASGKVVNQRFPTVLIQTGYNKDASTVSPALGGGGNYIVQHGYAQVIVDTRGTGRSEGEWESFGALEQSDYPAPRWRENPYYLVTPVESLEPKTPGSPTRAASDCRRRR